MEKKWKKSKRNSLKRLNMKSGFDVEIRNVIKDDVIIDESYVLEPKQVSLPIKKQVTKKVNNCRDLESKSKRK